LKVMGLFGFGKKKDQDQWGFPVGPNTAVFTTSFVLDGKPVTYVSHDIDGDWQFFSEDKYADFEAVAKVVGLKEMIEHDPTLASLFELPKGMAVTRARIGDQWKAHKLDAE